MYANERFSGVLQNIPLRTNGNIVKNESKSESIWINVKVTSKERAWRQPWKRSRCRRRPLKLGRFWSGDVLHACRPDRAFSPLRTRHYPYSPSSYSYKQPNRLQKHKENSAKIQTVPRLNIRSAQRKLLNWPDRILFPRGPLLVVRSAFERLYLLPLGISRGRHACPLVANIDNFPYFLFPFFVGSCQRALVGILLIGSSPLLWFLHFFISTSWARSRSNWWRVAPTKVNFNGSHR